MATVQLYNNINMSIRSDTMGLYEECKNLSTNLIKENIIHTLPIVRKIDEWDILGSCKYLKNNEYFYKHFEFRRKIFYISDIHLVQHIQKKYPNGATDEEIKCYINRVVKDMFSGLTGLYLASGNKHIFFCGDTSSVFEISKLFYTEFMNELNKQNVKENPYYQPNYVYAVLGNHEYWGFDNIDECNKKYQMLFDNIGIKFLNNTILELEDIVIIGGTGFAGNNINFNANNGIYRNVIDRKIEIELTDIWNKKLNEARSIANEKKQKLLVITHNPIQDWTKLEEISGNSIYINGHTHYNTRIKDDDKELFILSDNQIGYRNSSIELKEANIYLVCNPYDYFENGCRETCIEEYLKFNQYIAEEIRGFKAIEKKLEEKSNRMYVVKYNGFYGFFIRNNKGIYICSGGSIKSIKRKCTMWTIYKDFSKIIDIYLGKLTPYRNAQERISNFVKSIGGNGKIHGSIIDIDFFNHIMLNPNGEIHFYYSPEYGVVQVYKSVYNLLKDHNKALLKGYLQLRDGNKQNGLIVLNNSIVLKDMVEEKPELEKIDIKNSPYAFSIRMNQLQRLFDKKVLRDWNEELLHKDDYCILGISEETE